MTGAGSGSLAFVVEDSFNTLPGSPQYYEFGRNVTISELELTNALQRTRAVGEVESVESIAQRLEGAFAVEAVVSNDVHDEVHNLIFNDGGTGFAPGAAPSGRVYAGLDYLSGTAERELQACIPLEYSVTYEEDSLVRYSLSMAYADEALNTSITPSSVTAVSEGSSVPYHGAGLTIDSNAQGEYLQSATLSISGISRFRRGAQRAPVDAVMGPCETTFDTSVIITGTDELELAYGSASATAPQDLVGGVPASLDLATAGGTPVTTYNLSDATPESHAWSDLVAAETNTTEDIAWQVNGVSVA
jgi:hypothetical protein